MHCARRFQDLYEPRRVVRDVWGFLTIAKGTIPLAIFGPVGYGLRSGLLGAPARAAQPASLVSCSG